jgi:photosystem II stability/assembly factor-like uncharacterized protein
MRTFTKALILFHFLAFLILSPNLCAQWYEQDFPTNEWLMRVRFANEMVGWVLGFDHIYRTTDGGLNWVPQDSSWGYGEALYVLNDQTVFYSNFTGVWTNWGRGIRRTTDGGLTWTTVDTLPFFYTDFEFLDDQVGFGVGIDENNINAIIMTTDGGSTWNTISTNFLQTGAELQGITFVDDQKGWIVTYDSYVYNTTDGGINWALQDSIRPGGYWISTRDILFTTPDSGWIVGGISSQMLFARTTDGGENWIADVLTGGTSLREVSFVNNNVGWAVGAYNNVNFSVANTSDGGATWQPQNLIPPIGPGGFESISMINENIGWAVGESGQVYKTTNGGVVGIRESNDNTLPERFTLDQNYPNPFNPTTRIRYSLPTSAHVSLKVYNIAGQEVATLVNERQATGTHEAIFEADELPGGIYFYKLTSGSFGQTKKMLLIK